MSQDKQFKAEIRQLLDILIHSLYTEREIFLRELISNASDALNQLRFAQLTNNNVLDPDAELRVWVQFDTENNTLIVSDTGIGLTAEQMEQNLGTIAKSGAREFLAAAKENSQNAAEIIGKFGVGFYSVFMVADEVRVISRSYLPNASAAEWICHGGDSFQIKDAEKQSRGTDIHIKLKADATEFAQEYRLQTVIKTHSDFVAFPIYLSAAGSEMPADSKPVNEQIALWRKPAREVTTEEYQNFYRQSTFDFKEPLLHLHYSADAPVQFYSLLFVPGSAEGLRLNQRQESGLKLYNRKVLIQESSKDLLPEYLRFVAGVVDTEDLPLNVSRETVQANPALAKLKKTLTGRLIRELKKLAEEDATKYLTFWQEFGRFVKEGIATDFAERENLAPLLRFHTSQKPGEWSSLDAYLERAQPEQTAIYYLVGDEGQAILKSPHLDYFRKNGYEVLLLTEAIDPFWLQNLDSYKDKPLKNVAANDTELPKAQAATPDEPEQPKLADNDLARLIAAFKNQLGDRVKDVRTTDRLNDAPARLVDEAGTPKPEMQRVYRMMERDYQVPPKVLELNPRHMLVKQLAALPEPSELLETCINQVFANALLAEGLHPDPADMLPAILKFMEMATK